jgi:X-X-X-Leu-X-X-Gly heptad repeat protein
MSRAQSSSVLCSFAIVPRLSICGWTPTEGVNQLANGAKPIASGVARAVFRQEADLDVNALTFVPAGRLRLHRGLYTVFQRYPTTASIAIAPGVAANFVPPCLPTEAAPDEERPALRPAGVLFFARFR